MTPRAVGATAATALLLTALVLAWWGALDSVASERTHAAMQRALVTFALTRTLNGVISVAQGTELAFEPAGVGVVVSAGEILDPLNDLVEQFSWLTLMAASSLGIQLLLGQMFASVVVNVALTISIVAALVALWWRPAAHRGTRASVLRLTATFVFVRFAIALATLGTGLVDEYYLAQREQAAVDSLSHTRNDIDAMNTSPALPNTTPDSVLERLNKFLDDQRQALDVEARLTRLREHVEAAVENVVDLIVVYVIETLILPLGFLVVAWALVKQVWRRIV